MKKKKSKLADGMIIYGDYDVTEDLKQEALVRTTMFLGLDLMKKLKIEAAKKGIKYQQLMREILTEHLDGNLSVEKRLSNLENEVFKKKA